METQLPVSGLTADPDVQPRVEGIDADHVRTLMEAPDSWPPITVVDNGGRYVLVDGFHRLAAARELGLVSIPAEVIAPPADEHLIGVGFDLNARHCRPLSSKDRRAFAARLLAQHPDRSDRDVGRRCGLSHHTVGGIRRSLEQSGQIAQVDERTGADGKRYAVPVRPLGELAPEGLGEKLQRLVAGNRPQRRIASYLTRLAEALDDQYELSEWQTAADAAAACRLVFGDERARELGEQLGERSRNVLDVALALGYDEAEVAP